ncbi:MAG: Gfo/Idh/MocA family oxidoreductase [Myxococcota bacterium]|nr:Gfo/Idh/MocA family oxidoreductase [Myxococcota bacterium]
MSLIRIAVIGAGHWGPNLIRNFHDLQASAVGRVIDRDATRLAHVAARYPEVLVSTDAEDAFSDESIDGVVVATPTITHYPLVKRALEAGKHVLVEKPIATRGEEADELCELADRSGLVLMVGHVFLYNGAVRAVKQYLDAGELGRVYYISMVRTNLGPIRADVNAAWDLASHDVSIVNYWLDADPLTVSSIGGSWINASVEDAVFATIRYPDEVLVNLHTSWLNPRKARDITIVGERRMLTFDDIDLNEPIRIYDKYVSDEATPADFVDTFETFRASVRDGDIRIPSVTLGEPLANECREFIDCIGQGTRPISDGRVGARVVRALEALTRSTRASGREEKVERTD